MTGEVVEIRESMVACGVCDGPQAFDVYDSGAVRYRCTTDRRHTDWRYES